MLGDSYFGIEDQPLLRVEVLAQSIGDAKEKLEAEYGKGTVR